MPIWANGIESSHPKMATNTKRITQIAINQMPSWRRTPRSANMIGSQIGAVMIRKTSAASSTMKTVPSRLFSDPIHGEVQKMLAPVRYD